MIRSARAHALSSPLAARLRTLGLVVLTIIVILPR
jgi:hypothetical protein